MRWKLGTTAYKRVPSRDAAMDPDLETPDPAVEKTPDGGGVGAAGPSRRRSLPHVCVAMVTSFLFGYHTGYLIPLGQKMMASSSFQFSLYCVGFFVMIWIVAVMFKSDDILRKLTALKTALKGLCLSCVSTLLFCF
ncbi:uncharacterized protein LOC119341460 [Triticum dicoccoides]|uniref:uncharacterized protein LOC119341460 n=1 Tax=Triticum dicoccoides TaxID=85692 RepID=UPI001890F69C|nr:uncharacterized protein LOC119341460 [Triticum dicoccoides]